MKFILTFIGRVQIGYLYPLDVNLAISLDPPNPLYLHRVTVTVITVYEKAAIM